MTGVVQILFISGFKKCTKTLSTLGIYIFLNYISFYLNLYVVKQKCDGNCHVHKETIPLGLVTPVNKLLA